MRNLAPIFYNILTHLLNPRMHIKLFWTVHSFDHATPTYTHLPVHAFFKRSIHTYVKYSVPLNRQPRYHPIAAPNSMFMTSGWYATFFQSACSSSWLGKLWLQQITSHQHIQYAVVEKEQGDCNERNLDYKRGDLRKHTHEHRHTLDNNTYKT